MNASSTSDAPSTLQLDFKMRSNRRTQPRVGSSSFPSTPSNVSGFPRSQEFAPGWLSVHCETFPVASIFKLTKLKYSVEIAHELVVLSWQSRRTFLGSNELCDDGGNQNHQLAIEHVVVAADLLPGVVNAARRVGFLFAPFGGDLLEVIAPDLRRDCPIANKA